MNIVMDVGSSTVKVYKTGNGKAQLLFVESIPFKDGFDPETGIRQENKRELFELTREARTYGFPVRVMGTAQFRKLSPGTREKFVEEFLKETGLFFEVISQEAETAYLEKALVGRAGMEEPVLLVNIGGGSTELIIVQGGKAVERLNLDLGVGAVLNRFPGINGEYSEHSVEEVVSFVKGNLPEIRGRARCAVYTGGELNYMKLTGYRLEKNDLFEDRDHPEKISLRDFSVRNREIFGSVSFGELLEKMPQNPRWMHGSRACSALAQAIFEKYGIGSIIPSDSNIVDGYARTELG